MADGSSPFLDPRTFVSALGVRLPGKVAVSAAGEGHGGNLIFGLGRRFVKCLVFAVNVLQFDLDLYSVLFPGLQEVIRMASLMQPGMIASESLRKAVVQLIVHR